MTRQDIRCGKQDRLLITNVNLRLFIVDHANFRRRKSLGIGHLFEEIKLDVGRKLKKVTVPSEVGKLASRELLPDRSGDQSRKPRRHKCTRDLLGIGQTIGLINRAVDFKNLDIKQHFGVHTVVGQDNLFCHLQFFWLVPNDNRVQLFIGMHPLGIEHAPQQHQHVFRFGIGQIERPNHQILILFLFLLGIRADNHDAWRDGLGEEAIAVENEIEGLVKRRILNANGHRIISNILVEDEVDSPGLSNPFQHFFQSSIAEPKCHRLLSSIVAVQRVLLFRKFSNALEGFLE